MNNEIKKIIKVIDQIEIAMDRIDESKAADNDLKVELTQLALKMVSISIYVYMY